MICLLGLVFPVVGFATITFSPNDSEVELRWEDFGDGGDFHYLCFNDLQSCYGSDSDKILQRTDTEIVFEPSFFVPSKWELIVFINWDEQSFPYKMHPVIFGVVDDNDMPTTIACEDDTIRILGVWFGENKVGGSQWSKIRFYKDYYQQADILERWLADGNLLDELGLSHMKWYMQEVVIEIPRLEAWLYTLEIQNNAWLRDTRDMSIGNELTNDELSCQQAYLYEINVEDAWKQSSNKWEGITVAIIDDGVNFNHPDLEDILRSNPWEIWWNGEDDDNNGYIDDVHWWNFFLDKYRMDIVGDHGTLVAGIIAAQHNSIGIAWIAPNIAIMPLIISSTEEISLWAMQQAIVYAVDNGADIINISIWGVFTDSYYVWLDDEIAYAYENWVIVVSSAGNGDYTNQQARDLDLFPSSPVCNDGDDGINRVIWVASLAGDGIKADFSDYSESCVDVSAPWVNIVSTSHPAFNAEDSLYDVVNGTSFSTPMVVGAIALLWSEYPELTNTQIIEMVTEYGIDLDKVNPDYKHELWVGLDIDLLLDAPQPKSTNVETDDSTKSNSPILDGKDTDSDESFEQVYSVVNVPGFDEIVSWMFEQWLTKYATVSSFFPNELITREQAAKFFAQFADIVELEESSVASCVFWDIGDADYTLIPHIIQACEYGLLKWSNGAFNPFASMTRAEAVTVAVRSLEGFLDESVTPWYRNYYQEATYRWLINYFLSDMEQPITRKELWTLLFLAAYN